MAENEGKTSTSSKTDDPSEPKAKAASDVSTEPEAKGKRAPAKPAKGRAASARHAEEDDDEEDDDEEDDDEEDDDDEGEEEEEEEEEVKAPPPKRSASSQQKGKAASSAQKNAPKKGKASVYRKPPPPVPSAPRKPARYYVPYVILGLAFVALHVWFDAPFQPVACAGIAIVIWAYLQIGSANEIISSRR